MNVPKRRVVLVIRYFGLLIVMAGLFGSTLLAQTDSIPPKKRETSFMAIPLVYYTPETRWAFGLGGLMAFRFKNEPDTTLPSQVQLGFAYTLNKQLLLYLPFRLYWSNETYLAYGEVGYYKYNYYFYGIGNSGVSGPRELYDVVYPRLQLNFLRKVKGDWYLGGRYFIDDQRIFGYPRGGLLDSGNIPGKNGGISSGLGAVAIYDSRDVLFYPGKGVLAEIGFLNYSRIVGSDFNFSRFSLDVSAYYTLPWRHIVAGNFWSVFNFGDVPFTEMAQLGGAKKMRGFYQGRFRDKKLGLLQAEYRGPLFWRFAGVAFANWGMVAKDFDDFALRHSRFSYGAGLRFLMLKKEQVHIRIDYSQGIDGGAWYITVGEAF